MGGVQRLCSRPRASLLDREPPALDTHRHELAPDPPLVVDAQSAGLAVENTRSACTVPTKKIRSAPVPRPLGLVAYCAV